MKFSNLSASQKPSMAARTQCWCACSGSKKRCGQKFMQFNEVQGLQCLEQLGGQGLPVSHMAAGTEPGASKDPSREAESWVVVVLVEVAVTARCGSDPGKSCLLQLRDEPVSQWNKPIKCASLAIWPMRLPICSYLYAGKASLTPFP